MTLYDPFSISARLLPALKIGAATLSFEPETARFYLDRKEGEYVIKDFRPGPGSKIQDCFWAILSFMLAAGESRTYRERTGMEGENEDLFPEDIVDWIVDHYDELETLSSQLEEEECIE